MSGRAGCTGRFWSLIAAMIASPASSSMTPKNTAQPVALVIVSAGMGAAAEAYAQHPALLRLEDAGYRVVFSVHDEVIVEAPRGARVEEVQRIMAQPVDWAPGLDRYLHADGYETPFYKKD